MKKIIRIAFAIAMPFAFFSCGLFSDEMPVREIDLLPIRIA